MIDWTGGITTALQSQETLKLYLTRSEELKQMQVSVLENIFIVMVFLISDHFFSVGRLNQLCYVIRNDKQEQLCSLSPRICMLNYFFLSHVYTIY